MALQERKLEDVKWDKPGVSVAGHLIEMRKVAFDGKQNVVYTVLNGAGLYRFFGTTELNGKIRLPDVGSAILVEFVEVEKLDGDRSQKHFRVSFDATDRVPVGWPQSSPASHGGPAPTGPAGERDPFQATDDDIPF